MENNQKVYEEWTRVRMIAYREAGEVLTKERDALLRKNDNLYSWLCLSVVCNAIFIGMYLFFYFKTH